MLWCESRVAPIIGLVLLTLMIPLAVADELKPVKAQPNQCLDLIKLDPARPLVDWRESVAVEHCDRIKRLQRITEISSLRAEPQFFDGMVAASRLPPDVNVDLPLLRVVFPERVFFDTGSAELREEALEVVKIIAQSLRVEPPDVSLFVAGHADARGSREYNQNLSIDRANAVAESIMNLGVNVASVWRIGFGEDMPLVAGDSDAAYGQNRRVEFLFAARPEAIAAWLADSQIDLVCQGKTVEEAESCKQSLELKSDYYAVEIGKTSTGITPAANEAEVELTSEKLPVSPGSTSDTVTLVSQTEVHSPSTKKVILAPKATRKIKINPVNRKAGPIESSSESG